MCTRRDERACRADCAEYGRPARFAKQEGIEADDDALLNHDAVQKRFRQELERVNRELADFQRIKGFRLISKPFSIETGELTPTLKVKRRVVAEKYAHLLQEMAR